MCDKSWNTWLCVHWQWNTLEWCQLNAPQASPVVHLVIPLECVSLSMNTQPSVPTIEKPLSHQAGVLTATARRARKTQNAEVRAMRSPRAPKDRRGIAVASPLDAVWSPRTPCHGAHFVHAQSARRGSVFPRRSEWAPCERSGFAAATQ